MLGEKKIENSRVFQIFLCISTIFTYTLLGGTAMSNYFSDSMFAPTSYPYGYEGSQ